MLSHGASSDSWCEPSLIGAICCILAKCQGNGGLACHVHQCRACGDMVLQCYFPCHSDHVDYGQRIPINPCVGTTVCMQTPGA